MHFLAALLTAFLATAASGPVQGGADGILAQLSNLRLDKNQIYSIRDITLRRDALAISFNRGAIAFLEPVAGRVTGAVFVGSGEILSIPPGSAEKLQLFKFTGSPILNERFDAGLFRFTDDTYSEILRQYEDRAHEEVRAEDLEALLPWEDNLGERARLLNFRLLKDLIGNDERPLFFAELRSETMGWFDAVYDQRMAEEVTVLTAGRDSFLTDIWLSFNRRSEARDPESFAHEDPSPVDVLSYDIDLTIEPDTLLEAVTKLDLRARVSGERVLSFDMTPALRVSDVMLDDEAVPFFQYEESALDPFYEGLDRFVVVLPSATEEGAEMSLEFRYSGSILEDRGEGIYFVSERSLWYPSVGPQDPARFDLTFHFPASGELVATGSLLDERTDGELKHSRWTSGREFFVAGFNFGDFAIESHEDGPVPVFVCLNNDVETIFKEIESRRALEKELALRAAANRRRNRLANETVLVSPDFDAFSTRGLADSILQDVRSTVEFFSERFGPYPFDRLAVSQFPVPFSQGWPSLLYVSTLSFFTPEQRNRLGLEPRRNLIATEFVRAHEIAHQWFGNKIGWRSYRDQWIVEGFSNYAGAMYLAHKHGEQGPLDAVLDDAATRLFTRTGEETTHDDNGPIWLGHRLATADVPDGYVETVYNKSTWTIHMLRSLMQDREDRSDGRFLSMTRQLLDEFDGRLASTWDLKRIAESHMSARMDVRGDGNLDWFFEQWVFGTGAPSYDLRYAVEPTGGGFVVAGEIEQSGVSDFIMPVPLYGVVDDVRRFLGDVIVSDDGGDFSFTIDWQPASVELDPYNTILKHPR